MNKVILIGNVGKDPEVTELTNSKVVKLPLATNEKWKNKNGEVQEKVTWHNLSLWGNIGNIAQKWVKKGVLLAIEGKIEYTVSESNGEKKYFTSINVSSMKMLGGINNTQADPQKGESPAPNQDNSPEDEDLPF